MSVLVGECLCLCRLSPTALSSCLFFVMRKATNDESQAGAMLLFGTEGK